MQKQCLRHKGSGNTVQKQCLGHDGGGNTQGSGGGSPCAAAVQDGLVDDCVAGEHVLAYSCSRDSQHGMQL